MTNPKDILSKDFLEKEFVHNRKSVHQIAKENKIKSSNSISQAIVRHNLHRENLKNIGKILTEEYLIEQYINNNKSQKEIALELGIKNKTSIRKYLEKFKIPIRKHTKSQSYIKAHKRELIYEEIPKRYWDSIYRAAISRKLEFNITPKYCWELFIKQNRKCNLTNADIKFCNHLEKQSTQTASLDRKDSCKGYIEGNLQWVLKKINQIKMDLTEEEFIRMCEQVTNMQRNKNNDKT